MEQKQLVETWNSSSKKILCVIVLLLSLSVPCQAQNSHDLELGTNIDGANVAKARQQEEEGLPVIIPQSKSQTDSGNNATAGTKTVEVKKLKVTTDNEVSGGIEAKDDGQVSVGDAKLTKVNADAITINTKSTIAGKIEASDDGTFKAGTVNLENHQGQSVKISLDNTLNGNVTTKQKSIVSIGNTNSGGIPDQSRGVGNSGAGIGSSQPIISRDPSTSLPILPDPCVTTDICSVDCSRIKEWDCHIVDGCSYPSEIDFMFQFAWIFGKAEKCCHGAQPLPCNNHDRCYQTCHKSMPPWIAKKACDAALYVDAMVACARLPLWARLEEILERKYECEAEAAELLLGVTIWGNEAWSQRQGQFGCK